MRKQIIILITLSAILLLPKIASAGIILRPVLNTGLVGYWDFQEGAGNYVYDKSGKGNNGLWYGSGTSHWADGKIGRAGNFNGTDDYIDTNTGMGIDGMTELSVCAWMYWAPASVTKDAVIVSKWDDSDHGMFMWVDDVGNTSGRTNTISWTIRADSSIRIEGSTNLVAPQTWDYYCGTFKGSTFMRLYKNGILDQEITSSVEAAVQASTANVRIGRSSYSDPRYFDGKIDEVRIYNRALSESEIERLYKLSQPKIGINQLGLVSADLPSNATISYVREDCTGYSPCYNSLYDWELNFGGFDFADHSCTPGDLTCLDKTAVAKIDGAWNSPDTAAVIIDDWTTDATRYLKIYTTATARHPGKLDETKYILHPSSSYALLLEINYIKIDGLQVIGAKDNIIVEIRDYEVNSYRNIWISNSIFKATGAITWGGIIFVRDNYGRWAGSGSSVWLWNNIIYDSGTNGYAIYHRVPSVTVYAYNNTIQNCDFSFVVDASCPVVAKNNLIKNSPEGASGTFSVGTDYNATDRATIGYTVAGSGNLHDRTSQTFGFVSEARDDFHLLPGDSGARNYGADLSNDANISFSTDIDRQNRAGNWDIGADEARGTVANASQANQITNGLVGFWSFNGPDIDGNEAIDRSVNGNNGTITGATKTIGKVGQALSFDGNDDEIALLSPASLDDIEAQGGGGMSISAWVYPVDFSGGSLIIVSKGYAISGWWAFFIGTNDNTAMLRFEKGFADVDLDAWTDYETLVTSLWQHVAMTWDGSSSASKIHLYINGAETANNPTNGEGIKNPDANNDMNIGSGTYGNYFDGKIDEVRIYSRVLSGQEIQRLYNLGR